MEFLTGSCYNWAGYAGNEADLDNLKWFLYRFDWFIVNDCAK